MCVAGPLSPDLIATLSSPVSMWQWVIVTLLEEDGSIASELRAVFGVRIFTPHAVKPSVLSATTWKLGELRSVIRYSVKSFERRTTSRRGQLCCRSKTFALFARSHHVTSCLSSVAPPRPSIAPSPITPLPGAFSARIRGLQPRPRAAGSLTIPQLPGSTS